MEFPCSSNRAGASTELSVCSSPSSSYSFSLSEFDQPFTEQQLQAIEAIEAAYQATTAKRRRENEVLCVSPNSGRRLPRSISSLQSPHSSPLSPCRVTSKMRFPALKFGGRIVYSRTASEVDRASRELAKKINSMRKGMDQITIGFDIEWKPTFRRGVPPGKAAVMQLCLDHSQCHVMHIIHSGIPRSLQALLEDDTLNKAGVGIVNDAMKVFKDYNVSIKAVDEISNLANQKLAGVPKKWSLGSLTEALISKELPKPSKIRLGNWEVAVLSKEQLHYAATDAFASWYLHEILKGFPDPQAAADSEGDEEPICVMPQ
ncbi:Werner Syndrome-like exonuclease [Cucurbita moschata]|uniref:3'-5' exonuclease n=1 Tax=Cucurbita moschata TaxID=3662 RepID=A0A6J1G5L3_CUCMO|nr:Werner Syndrome-like exonuclease [Cucurbita moschata]